MAQGGGSDSTAGARAAASAVLARLRPLFDTAVQQVAGQCAVGGRLDAARLDAQQVVCHELALASADLLAAEIVVDGAVDATPRDAGLALAFAVEAALAVIARLETVAFETG